MPIHDWTRLDADLFHAFRHRWLTALRDAMNDGGLPEGQSARVEPARGGDRMAVRDRSGGLIGVVEVVSPRDKADETAVRSLVAAMGELIRGRVHAVIVDLFPPGPHDPRGIHNAIWDALESEDIEPTADRPLVAVAYDSGAIPATYVEPLAVGDVLPEMPLFVAPDSYVPTPLESTYQAAWNHFPDPLKGGLADGPV